MGKIVIVLALMASGSTFAAGADSQTEIRVRPSRSVVIKCYQGANAESIQGASDDLKILRVGQTEVGYEVYVDDFFVASCDNIVVNGH
jgi:hypothetical protein